MASQSDMAQSPPVPIKPQFCWVGALIICFDLPKAPTPNSTTGFGLYSSLTLAQEAFSEVEVGRVNHRGLS